MILVTHWLLLKFLLDVQQTHLRGRFIEQMVMLSSYFLGTPNLQIWKIWFWSHFVVLFKSDLDVQQTHLRGQFIEQMLIMVTLCCAT